MAKRRALEALNNGHATVYQLLTLTSYLYSKQAMEKLFLCPQITDLFVESVNFLRTMQGTSGN